MLVIDEAHSSQGGKTSAAISQALGEGAEQVAKINQWMKNAVTLDWDSVNANRPAWNTLSPQAAREYLRQQAGGAGAGAVAAADAGHFVAAGPQVVFPQHQHAVVGLADREAVVRQRQAHHRPAQQQAARRRRVAAGLRHDELRDQPAQRAA